MTKTLTNALIAWRLEWEAGRLSSTGLENRLTSRWFALSTAEELALVLSAAPDRLAEPLLRVSDFIVRTVHDEGADAMAFALRSEATGIEATLRYSLDGEVRRKTVELRNDSDRDILVLDVVLDDFAIDASLEGGGQGQPIFAGGELFAAMEHPSGWNETLSGRITLSHCPGRRLAPGETMNSRAASLFFDRTMSNNSNG